MTRDHIVIAIGQNRDIEPEGFDASGDLADLLLAVPPRVSRVRFEFCDSTIRDD